MKTEEPVLFTLEDVFFQAQAAVRVGDLFFSQERICFIPYTVFFPMGGAGAAAGLLLGGLAGAASTSMTDKNFRDGAIAGADKIREKYWGIELRERLKLGVNVISISRKDISEFNLNKNVLSLRTDGSHMEFGVNNLADHKDKLSGWHLGGLVGPATCVITSKYLAPFLAFKELSEAKQCQEVVKELDNASGDKDYMGHLWTAFEVLPKETRNGVIKALENFGGPFKDAFASLRQSANESGRNKLVIGSIALAVGILATATFIPTHIDTDELSSFLDFLWMLLMPAGLVFGTIWIFKGYKAAKM